MCVCPPLREGYAGRRHGSPLRLSPHAVGAGHRIALGLLLLLLDLAFASVVPCLRPSKVGWQNARTSSYECRRPPAGAHASMSGPLGKEGQLRPCWAKLLVTLMSSTEIKHRSGQGSPQICNPIGD